MHAHNVYSPLSEVWVSTKCVCVDGWGWVGVGGGGGGGVIMMASSTRLRL